VDDNIRISTSCYAKNYHDARIKLGLDEFATLDDILKRVIHGNADQQLSLQAWLTLGKRFLHEDRA
jgi:hypothetical protein